MIFYLYRTNLRTAELLFLFNSFPCSSCLMQSYSDIQECQQAGLFLVALLF